ncbi:MAG: hypothetical protein KDC87_11615 [Planctomycetes bacterium]|nr:hypothetical protein [Planctomycetota bacterium]
MARGGSLARSTAYLRLTHSLGESNALQTAVARFVPRGGERELIVDLVAAVHYADAGYYAALNRLLDRYDAVLYELVAPLGTRPVGGGAGADNPLTLVQRVAQSLLGLQSQLERVDYTRSKFVHADLSPAQLWEGVRARGDDQVTLLLGIAADVLRESNRAAGRATTANASQQRDLDLFEAFTRPGGRTELKRAIAGELVLHGTRLMPTLERLLIVDRNRAAMRELRAQIAAGKRRIAIFYGAGHMADFERRLRRELGLRRTKVEWLTAWDLRPSDESPLEGMLQAVAGELLRPAVPPPASPIPPRLPRRRVYAP